jgi:hypothetical protein
MKRFTAFFAGMALLLLGFSGCDLSSASESPAARSVSDESIAADVSGNASKAPYLGGTGANAYIHILLPDQFTYCGGTSYDNPPSVLPFDDTALFSGKTVTNDILYLISGGNSYTTYGYSLDQFVSETTVRGETLNQTELANYPYDSSTGANDSRQLYAVVSKANWDSFTNRSKFGYYSSTVYGVYNTDLNWETFKTGYLLDAYNDPFPTDHQKGRIHFVNSVIASPTQIKMYNTKWALDLYLLRKIDVKRPDATGTIATFEVGATTDGTNNYYVSDAAYYALTGKHVLPFNTATVTFTGFGAQTCISMVQFISNYIILPGTHWKYTYRIYKMDGTYTTYTNTQMTYAYYVPEKDCFCVGTGAASKVYFPVRIEVIGSTSTYDWATNGQPPAYALIP